MNAFPCKLLVFALCSAMISAEWRQGYFARLPRDGRSLGVRASLRALAVSTLITAMVLLVDPELQAAVQGIRAPLARELIHFGGWLGRGTALWVILLAVYAAAALGRQAAVKAAAFGCAVSAALASVLSSLIKLGVARARPNADLGPLAFFRWADVVRRHALFQSFPSGDTVIVAAVAWYLFYRCRNIPAAARYALFILPLATACSRVLLNRHWPSDTVFSIGLAWVSAQAVARYELRSGSAGGPPAS